MDERKMKKILTKIFDKLKKLKKNYDFITVLKKLHFSAYDDFPI